jgi:hypothetical protein
MYFTISNQTIRFCCTWLAAAFVIGCNNQPPSVGPIADHNTNNLIANRDSVKTIAYHDSVNAINDYDTGCTNDGYSHAA